MDTTKADSPVRFWRSLPEELKALLRPGYTGRQHLLDIAAWCLHSGNPLLDPLARDALTILVREHPLDGAMAREMTSLETVRDLLPTAELEHLLLLARHWAVPENLNNFHALRIGRDFPAIKAFLRQARTDEPDNLFWLEQSVEIGCFVLDPEFLDEQFGVTMKAAPARVARSAWEHTDRVLNGERLVNPDLLLDRALLAPWDVSSVLRAHDLLTGVRGLRKPLDGNVAVLLYSWNKGDELDRTLASLALSDLTGASLFVLDNGSTDNTPDVLGRWEKKFRELLGRDRFSLIRLPVNVGAAAARNWLLHLDAVRALPYVCYLDDDVELGPDWLAGLGAAVDRYPEAGVWGCKVLSHANPLLIQSADSHLVPGPSGPMDLTRMNPNPFRLTSLHAQTLDTGEFNFMRPCASVTGCCHLFRTDVLLESGDFAIQLSPSQYDDMEHDLRLCEAGLFPVYQGHVTVLHKKNTGVASHGSMQEEGNALGNKYKMQTMHDGEAIRAASVAEQQMLEADILAKLQVLEELGGGVP